MSSSQETMLKTAFLVGAVTDGLALVPMVVPPAAEFLWGFDTSGGAHRFAVGYGAALMLGWTALLVGAYHYETVWPTPVAKH